MNEDFEPPPKVAGILDQQLATLGYIRVLQSVFILLWSVHIEG